MASSGNASSFQPQVRKSLLQLIFSGAYLLRWNDKLRPRDLLEIDKQGHKMIVATLLWDKMSRELSAEKRFLLGTVQNLAYKARNTSHGPAHTRRSAHVRLTVGVPAHRAHEQL